MIYSWYRVAMWNYRVNRKHYKLFLKYPMPSFFDFDTRVGVTFLVMRKSRGWGGAWTKSPLPPPPKKNRPDRHPTGP